MIAHVVGGYSQGLIQDYYERGGYCHGSRRDRCAKLTSLGVFGGMLLIKSACSEIDLEPSEPKYHNYT